MTSREDLPKIMYSRFHYFRGLTILEEYIHSAERYNEFWKIYESEKAGKVGKAKINVLQKILSDLLVLLVHHQAKTLVKAMFLFLLSTRKKIIKKIIIVSERHEMKAISADKNGYS